MENLNKNIILMDHLYKYEHSDVDIDNIYSSIKNEIYQVTLFSDKPSANVFQKFTKNIKDIYTLNYIVNFYIYNVFVHIASYSLNSNIPIIY